MFVLQDAQFSLAWRSSGRYVGQCRNVAELGERTSKPIVVVSSSGEALHPDIKGALAGTDIPLLRGLRPALAAMGCLGTWFARTPEPRRLADRAPQGERAAVREALRDVTGPLSGRSDGAAARRLWPADGPLRRRRRQPRRRKRWRTTIGYPLVVKVVSRDVPHRSDVGGVQLGITDAAGLRQAIAEIERNVRAAVPAAVIDGYELQEELIGCVEAMAGFKSTPPFGALTVVGTGGTLVELQDDRALSLSPVTQAEAELLIGGTRLGALLGGYRNLLPPTAIQPLAALVAALSDLAADLADVLVEADLNPVLVRKGSGEVRVVDALFIAGPQRP